MNPNKTNPGRKRIISKIIEKIRRETTDQNRGEHYAPHDDWTWNDH